MAGRQVNLAGIGPANVANFDTALVDSIENDSDVQQAILDVNKNKGWYATEAALNAAQPPASQVDGNWAIVGSTDTVWVFDSDITAWKDSGLGSLVTSVFSRTGAITAQANDYTWAQIDKTISSIADITTRNHTDLTAGDGSDHSLVASALQNVVEDTTPQLGGNLDGQGNNITDIVNITATNNNMTIGTTTAHSLFFDTGGSTRMLIDSTGGLQLQAGLTFKVETIRGLANLTLYSNPTGTNGIVISDASTAVSNDLSCAGDVTVTKASGKFIANGTTFGQLQRNTAGALYLNHIGSASGDNIVIRTNSVDRIKVDHTGIITFNEDGISTADIRMEGDTDANLFFLDADLDRIAIGGTTLSKFSVIGTANESIVVFKGFSTQTNPILEIRQSDNTSQLSIYQDGSLRRLIAGNLDIRTQTSGEDIAIYTSNYGDFLYLDDATGVLGIGASTARIAADGSEKLLITNSTSSPNQLGNTSLIKGSYLKTGGANYTCGRIFMQTTLAGDDANESTGFKAIVASYGAGKPTKGVGGLIAGEFVISVAGAGVAWGNAVEVGVNLAGSTAASGYAVNLYSNGISAHASNVLTNAISIFVQPHSGAIINAFGMWNKKQTAGTNNYCLWLDGDTDGSGDASIWFGAGKDAWMGYNATNLVVDPKAVGSGILQVDGAGSYNQDNTTGAIPVLSLDQADVSEEFIRFIGTAASGVLTQSIVDDGDVTTETLVGWVKVYVQDDGNQITDQAYFMPLYTIV